MHRVIALFLTALATISFAFDHQYSFYGEILSGYVVNGRVMYDKLASDSGVLSNVKREFESVSKDQFDVFTQKEQIAFLINAYNLYTIELIVKNLPLRNGIRDISSPWDRKFILLIGEKVSLNHIEHDLLRKKYTEPRIHFALVCASLSCPDLIDKPFIASQLDTLLNFAGRGFLKDTAKNRIDGETLYLSKIFKWYGSDFGKVYKGGYIEYISNALGIRGDEYEIKFLPYDWNLNRVVNIK